MFRLGISAFTAYDSPPTASKEKRKARVIQQALSYKVREIATGARDNSNSKHANANERALWRIEEGAHYGTETARPC